MFVSDDLGCIDAESLLGQRRVAIVHDQLYTVGGAEKVLAHLREMIPHADLFALYDVLDAEQRAEIAGSRPIRTTFLQGLPALVRMRKLYLALMPVAIEQLDLRGYDVVVTSSYLVAKGVLTSGHQLHVCYLHSPMRYAWDHQESYVAQIGRFGVRRFLARMLLHYVRSWDVMSATRPDVLIANSHFIRRRIEKVYRRTATVVYPPVDVAAYEDPATAGGTAPPERSAERFVTMSRLVEGKRIELLLDAFARMPHRQLDVLGDGPLHRQLADRAPPNVVFFGRVPDAKARDHIAGANAFVYAAEEDFGMTPVEAQACGTPVIAFGSGGTAETVRDLRIGTPSPTGVLFHRQDPEAICAAVEELCRRRDELGADACRVNARRFGVERFRTEFLATLAAALAEREGAAPSPMPWTRPETEDVVVRPAPEVVSA